MHNIVRTIISIVISALLLGIAVAYCINRWMPADSYEWVKWGLVAALAAISIARIATLAKSLGKKNEE